MKLASIAVSVPVLEFQVEVAHSFRRSATALEKILFQLGARSRTDKRYDSLSLDVIFAEILGVPSSSGMLQSTVKELLDLGVYSLRRPGVELHEISISDLEPTKNGAEMLRSGQLPAVSRKNTETIVFNPISLQVLKKSDAVNMEHGARFIDSEPFAQIEPLEKIWEHIESADLAWRSNSAHIDDVQVSSRKILWIEERVELNLIGDELRLRCDKPDLENYLNGVGSQKLLDSVIGMDLFVRMPWEIPRDENSTLGLEPIEVEATVELPLAIALAHRHKTQTIFFKNTDVTDRYSSGRVADGMVVVKLDAGLPSDQFSLEWNEDFNGCTVSFGGVSPFGDSDIIAADTAFRFHEREIQIGGSRADLPLVALERNDTYQAFVDSILHELQASLIDSEDLIDSFLPMLWMAKTEFWETYVPKRLEYCDDLEQLFNALNELRRLSSNVGGASENASFELAAKEALADGIGRSRFDLVVLRSQFERLVTEYPWANGVVTRDTSE